MFLMYVICCSYLRALKQALETRSVYVQYIQVIQPNVSAHTAFIEIYVTDGMRGQDHLPAYFATQI